MSAPIVIVDTSALAAVVFGEADAERYAKVLTGNVGMCAAGAPTLVEAEIVVEARLGPAGVDLLRAVIDRIELETVQFDADHAAIAVAAWRRFGKGRHTAALNLGDCFSYAVARHFDVPLLFKGDDFSHTDIRSAL